MAVSEIPNAKRQIPKNSQRPKAAVAAVRFGRDGIFLAFEHWLL
jgi:hypothetical protein